MVASFLILTLQGISFVFNWVAFPFLLTNRRVGERKTQMK